MKYHRVPLGPIQTNCYLLVNNDKECLIVDPGGEGKKLNQLIHKQQYKPQAVVLTHAHFDHIGGVDDVASHFSIPIYVHKKEKSWLKDPEVNGSTFFGLGEVTVQSDVTLFAGEGSTTIGSFSFELYETPGHSPGSVSLYFKEAELVISGDALFEGSVGRTDLHDGNHEQLLKSIHTKLLVLPEETLVLSGHGAETTIGQEMDHNPFLNGF
ncbi:MBL fold metallo-hydrolase [Bacillus sp. 1780r2a1]|uniref:MBL fold metallo-hydrolase n=1 Tax=Priestia flexa TaxID=86664 RepID=UPI00220BD5D4|nr:MBL fold metallo-hydrolase [Bacillus sp. 1780r2a1]